MKKIASLFILFLTIYIHAQNDPISFEKYPVFSECAETEVGDLKNCFNFTLQQFVYENFKTPEIVNSEKYSGGINVFFEVDKEGRFKVRPKADGSGGLRRLLYLGSNIICQLRDQQIILAFHHDANQWLGTRRSEQDSASTR